MSNQQQVVGIEDKEILHDFIEEAQPLLSRREEEKQTLSDIFRRAAIELEKYYEDHSMICARLSRIWKDEARLIRHALPDKYKRGYGEQLEYDLPVEEIDEVFLLIQDNMESLLKVTKQVIEKIKINPNIHKKILSGEELTEEEQKQYKIIIQKRNLVLKGFGNISELRKLIEKQKDLALDVQSIQNDFDDRLKLDEFKRVVIKLYDLIYRYRAIGKIWHKSAKWIKQVVEDPDLEAVIEQASKCPECGFDWAHLFNKEAKRIAKGLEPKMPSGFYASPERFLYPKAAGKKA